MNQKFSVELMEEVDEFLSKLNEKAKRKIIYNIRKAQVVDDSELFKKLNSNVWEFGHFTTKLNTDFLHFGIKRTEQKLLSSQRTELKRKLEKYRKRKLIKLSG